MEGVDNTLRLPKFKGIGYEDPKQHLFICETIWTTKNIHDDGSKIVQLATTFRVCALVWYMKLQSTTPSGQTKKLLEILAEIRDKGPKIVVVTCGGIKTRTDATNKGKQVEKWKKKSEAPTRAFDPQEEKETYKQERKELMR
jgi:hypothetical protein